MYFVHLCQVVKTSLGWLVGQPPSPVFFWCGSIISSKGVNNSKIWHPRCTPLCLYPQWSSHSPVGVTPLDPQSVAALLLPLRMTSLLVGSPVLSAPFFSVPWLWFKQHSKLEVWSIIQAFPLICFFYSSFPSYETGWGLVWDESLLSLLERRVCAQGRPAFSSYRPGQGGLCLLLPKFWPYVSLLLQKECCLGIHVSEEGGQRWWFLIVLEWLFPPKWNLWLTSCPLISWL